MSDYKLYIFYMILCRVNQLDIPIDDRDSTSRKDVLLWKLIKPDFSDLGSGN